MRAIPVPLRKRILELYKSGKSTQEIARLGGDLRSCGRLSRYWGCRIR